MTDKIRHRRAGVRQGTAPNWLLMLLGACAVTATLITGPLL
jgi:hypothetical protein